MTEPGGTGMKSNSKGSFDDCVHPDPRTYSPTMFQAIVRSVLPLFLIFWSQPLVILGILGMPWSWYDVLVMDMDLFGLINEKGVFCTLWFFWELSRPVLPGHRPTWMKTLFPFLANLITSPVNASAWGISVDGTMPVNLQDKNSSGFSKWSSAQSNSRDTFVYVNGICTTDDMAKATGRELSDMLKKDIAVVHNPTHSMLVDLAECVFGKLWTGENWVVGQSVNLVYKQLRMALSDGTKTKVVLIAHSQGTIIASDVLWRLWDDVDHGKLPQAAMRKLEMYNVANAAHYMEQRPPSNDQSSVPYIENICNQRDNVGILGVNAPTSAKTMWNIDVAGKLIFPTRTRWGHMISAHYIKHLKKGDYPGSKLHEYIR